MSVLIAILVTFHVLVSLLMIGIVLMQRPKSEGLGAAFGGGMTENMFGAQTTHVLQKFTVWLGILFFALTLLLAVLYARRGTGETAIQRELLAQPIPAASSATPTPTTPAPETPSPDASAIPAVKTTDGETADTVSAEAPSETPPPVPSDTHAEEKPAETPPPVPSDTEASKTE